MSQDNLPTVSIKGNDYVLVKDRVAYFNSEYKNGSIRTDMHSYENGQVIVRARVIPDVEKPERYFTGWSQAKENDGLVNKTAALENAESSAVGRALAMMGIGVIESIASADELHKAGIASKAILKGAEMSAPVAPPAPQEGRNNEIDEVLASMDKEEGTVGAYSCRYCGSPATLKSGSKKNGEPWKGIFCDNNRDHQPEWL